MLIAKLRNIDDEAKVDNGATINLPTTGVYCNVKHRTCRERIFENSVIPDVYVQNIFHIKLFIYMYMRNFFTHRTPVHKNTM